MNKYEKLTRQQVEDKMETYRELYTVVRLLDEEHLLGLDQGKETGDIPESCQCYAYWNKKSPCENCISLRAFHDKARKTKLEFMDQDIFQVTSDYVEVDGRSCVMELVQRLDDTTLIDTEGRKKLIEKLTDYKEKLYRDTLTGAYNRRYFEEEIKAMRGCAGIAMIDMDDFKLFNDTSGHNAGDAALKAMVRVIQDCVKESDILVRYGGDEFLLVMPQIHEDIFPYKLEQIRKEIYSVDVPGYAHMQLSVSIGGVLSGENETIEEAIVRADKLMYQAKNRKNMVVTEQDLLLDENGNVIEKTDEIKQQILIVDDSEVNREILTEILHTDYRILEAANGQECIDKLRQYGTGISVVLLDIIMPQMDGFDVLNAMEANNWLDDIPVIVISSDGSDTFVRRAYGMGVADYISRPFDSKVVYQRVSNIIKLYAKQRYLISLVTDQIYEKEKNNKMLIGILSHVVEFRNGESGSHMRHISQLTQMLLEHIVVSSDAYRLNKKQIVLIATASALHDIGKIGIEDSILNKPGRLTDEEFAIMKTHTVIGAQMLEQLEEYQEDELVKVAYEICRWHHERYDGHGYPDGLVGEQIPIAAQVVSLADVYDALVSERVYKKAFSHEKAIEMIVHGECGTFNPLLIDGLLAIQEQIREWVQKG